MNCVVGTDGPPVLLLYGFPQNLVMWARVAPQLANRFTVVCADLRGYGDSSKPRCAPDKSNYAFRAMAGGGVPDARFPWRRRRHGAALRHTGGMAQSLQDHDGCRPSAGHFLSIGFQT